MLLKDIYTNWFNKDDVGTDPKYDEVSNRIDTLLDEEPNRKIVIFSGFADTANYVASKLVIFVKKEK